MVRIFKIFLIAVIFVSVISSVNGEITLGNRCYLYAENSDGGDREFLYNLQQYLQKIAGKTNFKRRYKKITFRTNAGKWNVAEKKQQFTVHIPGNSRNWLQSFAMRRMIYGIVFDLRFDLIHTAEAGKNPLPLWMSAGIDEVVLAKKSAEKLVSRHHDYSVLQTVFKNSGTLPDFGALCRFKTIPEDPAMAVVYRQMSCLLLELATVNKLMQYMLECNYEKLPDDYWLNRFPSPQEAQVRLVDAAKKILWGKRSPIPAPLLSGEIEKLQTIVVPELDPAGIPGGKMLNLSFAEANKLFFSGKRPDIKEVREYYNKEWLLFSLRRSAKVRELALKLSELALAIGENEDWAEKFEASFRQLKEQLEFEEKQYRAFIRIAFENLAVEQLYLWQFAAGQSFYRAAGVGAGGKFLENTEKEYFKKY